MAWRVHWQCLFNSLGGTQYAVNIYEQDYSGSIIRLTGASEPFVTQEADDDDIFAPVRTQTGYLRVIDYDGTLMEDIIPANNTQKKVILWSGRINGSGNFVPVEIKWIGFLRTEAFTQPWEDNANVIEFPVQDVLAALESVTISSSHAGEEWNIAKILWSATDALLLEPDNDITSLCIISDAKDALNNLLKPIVQMALFFDTETENNQGDSNAILVGQSFYTALYDIMSLYGMQLRLSGGTIYLSQYDTANNKRQTIGYGFLSALAGGATVTARVAALPSYDMLQSLTFRGDDSTKGFLPGARSAKVRLDLSDGVALHINLPQTTEDASDVYEVQDIYSGQVFVQPHPPRSNSTESFSYYEYQQQGQSGSNLVGSSNYQKCLNNCVIFRPLFDPHWTSSDNLHTGAFPCRWYYKKDPGDLPTLKNGLFVNQQYLEAGWSFTPNYCYSIKSPLPYSFTSGYLNIDLLCNNFMRGLAAGDSKKLYFGDNTTIWSTKPQTTLYCILTWGNKEWDGNSWITHSGNYKTFTIIFDGASVKTNKTAEMQVSGNSGWYIPITEEMSGTIRLYILNVADTTTELGHHDAHSKILTDLVLEYLPPVGLKESQRDQNTYRQQIMASGFAEDKERSLSIGTYNNNRQSVSFLKADSTTYKEALEYFADAASTTYFAQRPELHLLARMAAHYNQVRRTLQAIVKLGVDIFAARYAYLGRTYFGVAARTNWREDEQDIKFIEVT